MLGKLLRWFRAKQPKPLQQSELEGEGNVVVQVVGDGNSVAVGYSYLRLTRFVNRRLAALPEPTETDLLQAHARSIDLLGREAELSDLWNWLTDARPISVRVMTGSAGRGKTRLALEVCEQAAAKGWRAGFLTGPELKRFLAQQNAAEWGWNAPTLAVIDYAATGAVELSAWLRELSDHRALTRPVDTPPLRLLLLERQADPAAAGGWWHTVFGGGDSTGAAVRRLLDRPEPMALPALASDDARRAVMAGLLRKIGSELVVPAAKADAYLDDRLSMLTWGGEPLFLMMAALLAAKSDFAAVLGLSRDDLALRVADRELERVAQLAEARGVAGGFARHMTAVATLRQGIAADNALAVIGDEREAQGHDGIDRAIAKAVLEEALYHPDGRIAAVAPDMVGEAVLLRVLGGREGLDGVAAVDRAALTARTEVVAVVIRSCQDYAIHGHAAPLAWLDALGASALQDLPMLLQLLNALPQHSLTLRERTWHLTATAATTLRTLTTDDAETYRPLLATALNNMSNFLSALGRHDDALAAVEEAADLCRELAARHPDAFRPDLAMALNNMSSILSALGRRDDALAAVEQAADLYRELAARHPDAFRPDLAMVLNNMSTFLSALGRHDDALAAVEEAADLYRELAGQHPDAFRPNLARALGTLGRLHLNLENQQAASESFAEGLRQLAPTLGRFPHGLGALAAGLLQDYLQSSQAAAIDPDTELLAPIVQTLQENGMIQMNDQ